MNKEIKTANATCEIEVAFDVIGGKWKPLILWYLGEHKTIRFSQLQHLIPDITHKILTNQLRNLEKCGLVERTVYPEVPVKVEYKITKTGEDVIPILDMMCDWASKNDYFGYDIKYNICEESSENIL